MRTHLSVIVFAYNEADNVTPMLGELREWIHANEPGAEIVFVDDGSIDTTEQQARQALDGYPSIVTRHRRNRGIGAALKTGTALANGEWVTFLPADGQIAPEAIGVLLKAARSGADVVFSVYDSRQDGLGRKILSTGVRGLIALLHGAYVRSDGPYLFSRTIFDPEQLESETFFLNFEFPIRVRRSGLKVTTVTIACRPRLGGTSKSANAKTIARVAAELCSLRWRAVRETVARNLGRAS